MLGAALAIGATITTALPSTDFGVRIVGAPPAISRATESAVATVLSGRGSIGQAASLGAQWGRVTSTYRSVEHNRAVGGVPNSFHLSGRAIDIARRPGVNHAMIAEAYRRAGYRLVESLDEGDHSHFAFSFGGSGVAVSSFKPSKSLPTTNTDTSGWKVVYAPR